VKKVLVVSVHPDDETLGCGATLLKHKSQGDEICWAIVTNMSGLSNVKPEQIKTREEEISQVAAKYGFKQVHQLGLPSTKLDSMGDSELITIMHKLFCDVKPHTVYLPFQNDVHSDHRIIFNNAYACTKSFRSPFIKEIYMMETLSETEFAPCAAGQSFCPNVFVDITEFLQQKIEIMKLYKSELAPCPFPRSEDNIRALATLRGSTCGARYAESFMLLKQIK